MEAHLAGEDEEQARRFGWWPRRSGRRDYLAMLAADERSWSVDGPRRRFAVRAGERLVGGCEVRAQRERRAVMSYWTFPRYRSRGYATRATRLVYEWALAELAVDHVELHAEHDNTASRAVARKAGFRDTRRVDEDGLMLFERRR